MVFWSPWGSLLNLWLVEGQHNNGRSWLDTHMSRGSAGNWVCSRVTSVRQMGWLNCIWHVSSFLKLAGHVLKIKAEEQGRVWEVAVLFQACPGVTAADIQLVLASYRGGRRYKVTLQRVWTQGTVKNPSYYESKAWQELVQSLLISLYYPSELVFVAWDQRTLTEAELEGRMDLYLHLSLGSQWKRMAQNGSHGH